MATLYRMDSRNDEPTVLERDILKYINDTKGNDYTAAICEDRRFAVWFHLSDLRTGLFSWYDFRTDASLLEIGAGFGALTGLFCRKCAKVTAVETSLFKAEALAERYASVDRLTIYAGALKKNSFSEKFDYIILAGGLEQLADGNKDFSVYAAYLESLQRLLKPDGVLLIAAENRYGLRYFCGAREPYSGKVFAGICNDYGQGGGVSFSRNELENIFRQSGFEEWKFYYPLPDYKLPQMLYTDEHLPERNIRERLIPYYEDASTLLAYENDIYDDIALNGVFPFFANSFLAECGNKKNFSKAVYAALSTDRGRDKAFATVIFSDHVVQKIPVFSEGVTYAHKVWKQTQELQERGLPVLQHAWDGERISMPYCQAETLSNYLKKIALQRPAEVVAILDQLWQEILRSSDTVDTAMNSFRIQRALKWGPILRKAYLELIPLNCFYKDGRFLFFDQEYVRENYPAKYVLFRAIHYLYVFAPQIAQRIPLIDLQQRYGMVDLWSMFLQEEDEHFLPEVRRHALYAAFYGWAAVDPARMRENARFLGCQQELNKEQLFADVKGKKIVVFGAGAIFDEYMQNYGSIYAPELLVDNNEKKWGQKRWGIQIDTPKRLSRLQPEKLQVIVCSRYYKQIGEQLRQMGIQSYKLCPYIFV